MKKYWFLAFIAAALHAQDPVQQHIDLAHRVAAPDWTQAVNYFCSEDQTTNKADDPEFAPTKLFDNVYAIGRTGTATYAITTSAGIILIDAGYADQVDTVLLPGMKKLGLDPAQIKMVIVTHGHADHFGGAKRLQDDYHARVAMTAADWDFAEPKPGRAGGGVAPPKRDIIASDKDPLLLGEEKITVVYTPGHTPGAVGLIFPVRDHGVQHMAALYGGTVLLPGRLNPETMQQYQNSIARFISEAFIQKVDVELQNHPLMDGMPRKLAKLSARKAADPNPFVVGEHSYLGFLFGMQECMKAQEARAQRPKP